MHYVLLTFILWIFFYSINIIANECCPKIKHEKNKKNENINNPEHDGPRHMFMSLEKKKETLSNLQPQGKLYNKYLS